MCCFVSFSSLSSSTPFMYWAAALNRTLFRLSWVVGIPAVALMLMGGSGFRTLSFWPPQGNPFLPQHNSKTLRCLLPFLTCLLGFSHQNPPTNSLFLLRIASGSDSIFTHLFTVLSMLPTAFSRSLPVASLSLTISVPPPQPKLSHRLISSKTSLSCPRNLAISISHSSLLQITMDRMLLSMGLK